MRTRSSGSEKSLTPPASKASPAKSKLATNEEISPATTNMGFDAKHEQSQGSAGAKPLTEVLLGTKSVAKKTTGKTRTPTSATATNKQTLNMGQPLHSVIDECMGKEEVMEVKDSVCRTKQEPVSEKTCELPEEGHAITEAQGTIVGTVVESKKEGDAKEEEIADREDGESAKGENTAAEVEAFALENAHEFGKQEVAVKNSEKEVDKQPESEEHNDTNEGLGIADDLEEDQEEYPEEGPEEDTEICDSKEDPNTDPSNVQGKRTDESHGEHSQFEKGAYVGDDAFEEYGDRVDFEDTEEEMPEDDIEEFTEETHTLEEEHKELTAAAKERRIKKEHEIFVGGLDRDATEEDVRRVFEKIGKVVEVRLHRYLPTNKNKGYAFVKFASKEIAKRALSEMKNPVICGKRCGTAPSEDNDTLFMGNICNTWTTEAIRQKLKDYGVEGVENITLVPDAQHEGLSRGFAFLEFSCHSDAMMAYKRLQKPDVIFGHPERTAKVAFAEPLREPDPEIMAKVRTVFLDGLPPHWDEECVRKQLKRFGEIVRIVLARNLSTARRKDYGFVDFSTHLAAVSCIKGVNNTELTDGNSRAKLKARLSNPLPKTQAIKGGMCGGFLINRGGTGTFSRPGRGFGRFRPRFNGPNFHHNRILDRRGRGQTSRMRPHDYGSDNYNGGQIMARGGGRRGAQRGGYHGYGRGFATAGPSRPNFSRPWYDAPDRGPREPPFSSREPSYSSRELFPPEEPFDRPFGGRLYDNPSLHDEAVHGMKRPFYTTHHDPKYTEPRRVRARMYNSDPIFPFHGTHYHDTYGAGGDYSPRDYYGSDHGAYPPLYGDDLPYRGGHGYYY